MEEFSFENRIFVTTFSNNASNNGTLHVFDFDGSELWNLSTGDTFYYTSPAVADGKVYIGSSTSILHCYNANDGSEVWNTTVNGPIYSSPVVANDTVYFGTNTQNGTIYALNATDGTLRWSYSLNPPTGSYYNIMSSPAVSDGILFIGADDGYIHAFSHSVANITFFTIESVSSKKGHSFTARLNITTSSDAVNGWYVVVVSGVNLDGSSLAGIGTVYLNVNETVTHMPVLVHVPSTASEGIYKLYAAVYRLINYPEVLMDREGPMDVTVS